MIIFKKTRSRTHINKGKMKIHVWWCCVCVYVCACERDLWLKNCGCERRKRLETGLRWRKMRNWKRDRATERNKKLVIAKKIWLKSDKQSCFKNTNDFAACVWNQRIFYFIELQQLTSFRFSILMPRRLHQRQCKWMLIDYAQVICISKMKTERKLKIQD